MTNRFYSDIYYLQMGTNKDNIALLVFTIVFQKQVSIYNVTQLLGLREC
jgi:hypothetical protein